MMNSFVIRGGNILKGDIQVLGSKNSATKLVAATLLTDRACKLIDLPKIHDVEVMIDILKEMGAEVKRKGNVTYIRNAFMFPNKLPLKKAEKVRSSIVLLGPMLARFGSAELPYPGGDPIGTRSIATHLNAFMDLGFSVEEKEHSFVVSGKVNQNVRNIILDEFSVTATENILMFASLLPYKITISIAAEEPHIQDMINFLSNMGVRVSALPYHKISVHGRKALMGATQEVRADYIEAGTLVCAALAVGGDVRIHNFPFEDLELFIHRLAQGGANLSYEKGKILRVRTSPQLALEKIQTMIYPGIPTDLQSPLGVLATQSDGKTFLHDPLYEGRLGYLNELRKMGAKIKILDSHRAEIEGPVQLKGVTIKGEDIRGGMSLIIAGLTASGTTTIENAYQVDRGYEEIDKRLGKLGADIQRV